MNKHRKYWLGFIAGLLDRDGPEFHPDLNMLTMVLSLFRKRMADVFAKKFSRW